jgi:hypothetical protein
LRLELRLLELISLLSLFLPEMRRAFGLYAKDRAQVNELCATAFNELWRLNAAKTINQFARLGLGYKLDSI